MVGTYVYVLEFGEYLRGQSSEQMGQNNFTIWNIVVDPIAPSTECDTIEELGDLFFFLSLTLERGVPTFLLFAKNSNFLNITSKLSSISPDKAAKY